MIGNENEAMGEATRTEWLAMNKGDPGRRDARSMCSGIEPVCDGSSGRRCSFRKRMGSSERRDEKENVCVCVDEGKGKGVVAMRDRKIDEGPRDESLLIQC